MDIWCCDRGYGEIVLACVLGCIAGFHLYVVAFHDVEDVEEVDLGERGGLHNNVESWGRGFVFTNCAIYGSFYVGV